MAKTLTSSRRKRMGRFSVQFEIANNEDIVAAKLGVIPKKNIRKTRLSGVVDSGAARLVLPPSVVEELGLQKTGEIVAKYADGRKKKRDIVSPATVTLLDRSGIFSAMVEPGRKDALIGAIVLEELDFLPDCTNQRLVPRYPGGMLAEIE